MVTTANPRIKFTYADYRNTPDDKRYELIDGELIMAATPPIAHQRSSLEIVTSLYPFVLERALGKIFYAPTDVVLSDTDVVQPDILFVSNERAHIITEDNIRGAPNLVIEILSPSTAQRDRTLKRALYAKHGVQEYWQVDTDARTIAVLTLSDNGFELAAVYGEGQTLASPLLPGFALDLDLVF